MKRYLILLFALFTILQANAQEKRTTIVFEKTTINLGKIEQDNPVRDCFFVFKNTGDKKLYIHQVRPSCGCTSKRFPTRGIEPGARDTIFITYNGSSGQRYRYTAMVHLNSLHLP